MNQTEFLTTENNVFSDQGSNSKIDENNNESLIVMWLKGAAAINDAEFDSIKSKIENSADLLKVIDDDPEQCEQYVLNAPSNVHIFLILPSVYTRIVENIHSFKALHSIHIYGEVLNEKEMNDYYSKVSYFKRTRASSFKKITS